MAISKLWLLLKLSPFHSVKLEYFVEHSCLLPNIYCGYLPDSDFVGTSQQCNDWIENYCKRYLDADENY